MRETEKVEPEIESTFYSDGTRAISIRWQCKEGVSEEGKELLGVIELPTKGKDK